MTTQNTIKVTRKNIEIGDAIMCRNYAWRIEDGCVKGTIRREVAPMVVAKISADSYGVTFLAADGTEIHSGGNSAKFLKVVG